MITNLRKRATVIMFIVLLAFVALMVLGWGADITGRGRLGRRSGKAANILAVVGKTEVTREDYQAVLDSALAYVGKTDFYRLPVEQRVKIIQETWENAINAAVWQETLKRERVLVGKEELEEILKVSPPPELRQDTSWYVDGEFNYELYRKMLAAPNLDPRLRQFLEIYKMGLARELLRAKVRNDVRNGFRLTNEQIRETQTNVGTKMTVEALFLYELPPVDSNVSESEMQAYYDEHIEDFKRKKGWGLKTLFFPVLPSADDTNALKEQIEDVTAALDEGYPFEQLALDFTGDSSRIVTRPLDYLDAVEFETLTNLEEGEVGRPYFFRGAWHLPQLVSISGDAITYREIVFPLEYSTTTRDSVLKEIAKFKKRARHEELDSLIAEYNIPSRIGPFVYEDRELKIPRFPYGKAVQTFAVHSKPGDISDPFPVTNDMIQVFATLEIVKAGLIPLDSTRDYIRRRVIRQRALDAQLEYAQDLRRRLEAGASFANLKGMPHVSLDTIEFISYYEAEIRYSGYMAGACYALEPGEKTGPVRWNDDGYYAFFHCLERSFDPASPDIATGLENLYNVILNDLSLEVFNTKDVKDYRNAGSFYGGE